MTYENKKYYALDEEKRMCLDECEFNPPSDLGSMKCNKCEFNHGINMDEQYIICEKYQ